MKIFAVLFAVVACASASSLLGAAPLIPRVQVAPAQVSVVKQPITVQQPVGVPRSVPYPVRAVAYTAPEVHSPVLTPALNYAAVPAYAAAPAYAAPAFAPAAYAAPAFAPAAYAASAFAAPALLAH